MGENLSEQDRNETLFRARGCFRVWILAICLVAILPFHLSAATTTTSLLDISNWDITNGIAGMSNGLLTIGANRTSYGDVIRSKQSFFQPMTFTWQGWFPLSAESNHFVAIGQPPFSTNNGEPTTNYYGWATNWDYPNSIYTGFAGAPQTALSSSYATVSNGYVYGTYALNWSNNLVTWYFNGSQVRQETFVSSNPVYISFRAYDRQFKIESVNVTTGTQTSSTNGTCGAANLTTVTTSPTTNLCTTGIASTTTGTGPWYWTCDGINGGTPAICTAYLSSAPVDPTLTKSKLYMGTDDRFTASNSGITIYGGPGYDTVTISDGISGVTLDQNVERINFSGTASAYAFKQTGNKINIYNVSGSTLIATTPVQGDSDGTLLGFSDGTASALLSGGVMTLGGKTVSSTSAGVLAPTLTHVP